MYPAATAVLSYFESFLWTFLWTMQRCGSHYMLISILCISPFLIEISFSFALRSLLEMYILLDSRLLVDLLLFLYLLSPSWSVILHDLLPLSVSCALRVPSPFLFSYRYKLVASLLKIHDVDPLTLLPMADILQVFRSERRKRFAL